MDKRTFDRRSSESVATASLPAGNAEHVIQIGSDTCDKKLKVKIHSLKSLRRDGASVTAHQGRIYNVASGAAGAFSQQYREGSTTAAGTIAHTTDIDQPCYTDAAGRLYYNADGDAADKFDYELWYEVLV